MLHLYQVNRFDMLNARKVQEFVIFISIISKIPQKNFFPRSSMSIIYLWFKTSLILLLHWYVSFSTCPLRMKLCSIDFRQHYHTLLRAS